MERLRGFGRRFRLPWRSIRQIRRDVDDELAFHLVQRTEALQREGLTPEAAQEEAQRQFGDLATASEQLVDENRRGERHAMWLRAANDLGRDLRHSARVLLRSPGFTVMAIVVLALGIGVVATMFSIVNVLLLKPLVKDTPEELRAIYRQRIEAPLGHGSFSYTEFDALRQEVSTFSSLAGWEFELSGVEEGNVTRRLGTAFVSAEYFETLGVPLEQGRPFTLAEERGEAPATAVVSHDFWVRNGRDPGILGSTLRINGREVVVIGVAADGFTGTVALLTFDVWVPLAFIEHAPNDGRAPRRLTDPGTNVYVFGRLGDDVSAMAAGAELESLAGRSDENLPSPDGTRFTYIATAMPRLSISSAPEDGAGVGTPVTLVMGMSAVVLLIACMNLANMFLARGSSRRTEMTIRQSLGSGRARLVRQLLTEGFVLSVMGAIVGLLAAYYWVERLAASLAVVIPQGMPISIEARPDVRVVLVTTATCLIATLLFGLGPAWRVTGHRLTAALKAGTDGDALVRGRGLRRLLAPRNLLIVAQIALSLVMLTAGGLFMRAAIAAGEATPGFSVASSLLVELDAALAGYDAPRARELYGRVVERLRALPNVETAALTSQVPFSGVTFDISGVQRAGQANTEESVTAWQYVVSDGYFDTLRLPLLRGREFTAAEAAAGGEPRVGIIDETLALQLFDDRDAVGRQIQFPSQDGPPRVIEIVGVAPGTRQGLGQTSSHVYLPSSQPYRTNVYVHLRIDERVADPRTLLESIRNEIQRIDPALPVLDLTTLRDFVAEEFEIWVVRTAGRLFTWLGAAAVFMAFVGVYGVTMFLTSRRTREIGVRMALGATRERIMRQIVREGLGVTFAGVALGLVLAIAVARLLSSMLYEVSAIDPVVFIGATALLVVAATLASYLPVRRASRVHPTTALRYE